VLEEVVEAARTGLSRAENDRVEVSLDPSIEEAWLDPIQISLVLHNLLDNALKYSPAPSRVELRGFVEGGHLTFEVLDRGSGLPPGEEERVFERFYRAPALRESAVPGVGVGLSVCRGLVEAHGGSITGHNREGGGAVFRVTLPMRGDA
jgi:two-component system sensor histidine kinase KdpD